MTGCSGCSADRREMIVMSNRTANNKGERAMTASVLFDFTPTEKSLQQRARRAARRVGLMAKKSRWRLGTVDNYGGFMLLDPWRNLVRRGERFDMSAQEVIEYCDQ
jgi:hypothetical protein